MKAARRVAIQKPTDKENAVQAVVDINGHGISTSGSYRTITNWTAMLFHVIIRTRRPIEHNLVSVTVIAPTAPGSRCPGYWLDGTRAGES
ncbi:FAD:protein FMN transferase [Shigella flexneri]